MAEFQNKINKDEGFGVIEALLSIALGIILIVSLLTLTNFNNRNSLLLTQNQQALNSTNLLLETLRAQKENNFTDFMTRATALCVSDKCNVSSSGEFVKADIDINSTTPVSYFSVKKNSDSEIIVNIMTYWKVGNSNYSSPLSTLFSNWRAN
jgi:hypothetical protein